MITQKSLATRIKDLVWMDTRTPPTPDEIELRYNDALKIVQDMDTLIKVLMEDARDEGRIEGYDDGRRDGYVECQEEHDIRPDS